MIPGRPLWFVVAAALLAGCAPPEPALEVNEPARQRHEGPQEAGKIVVYQALMRLFGNTNDTNRSWGTIEENGVGKFADFDDAALRGIRELGVTHIWYTGVPHHAVIRDYTAYGISDDDPDVVKGRAGSPYAVKDYYTVDPDLATDPARRLEEFRALVERTHSHDMRVIIDVVPNHVARRYESIAAPAGVQGFGVDDDTSVEYRRDNDFYYVVGQPFRVPAPASGYAPLGGEPHPLADEEFAENPARWTGNGARAAQPRFDDWYETVKINFGVRPDGTKDFASLPADYATRDVAAHAAFWREQDVPGSWVKFRDIALHWLELGVDGFRFDMAEMVPVEFWSYLNATLKTRHPDVFLLAEIYNPAVYRDYVSLGKMDYLYDKVGLYDTLRAVVAGTSGTDPLVRGQAQLRDIAPHLLHFLENHDEQRIASPAFAGDPVRALPAMVVAATLRPGPVMIYFGQEVGETGAGAPGFGAPTRTTIFDYWGVPAHQRWMNGGRFDGGALDAAERRLREFYARLLNFAANSAALLGEYADLHAPNRSVTEGYSERLFAFARWSADERLIVVVNFDASRSAGFDLLVTQPVVGAWQLAGGEYAVTDQLHPDRGATLSVANGVGTLPLTLAPLESLVLKLAPVSR